MRARIIRITKTVVEDPTPMTDTRKPGFIAIYSDDGPVTPGGQDQSTNSPHLYILLFDSQEHAQRALGRDLERLGRNGENATIRCIYPDQINNHRGPIVWEDHRESIVRL